MISSIGAGVLAFLLTLIDIPAFIDFIEKHRLQVSRCGDVKQHQAFKLELQP